MSQNDKQNEDFLKLGFLFPILLLLAFLIFMLPAILAGILLGILLYLSFRDSSHRYHFARLAWRRCLKFS